MKVNVISLPYIFQVVFVLCFTWPRYQVSVYRTIGPLVVLCIHVFVILVVSHFDFEGGTVVLIAPIPGHCLPFIFHTCNYVH